MTIAELENIRGVCVQEFNRLIRKFEKEIAIEKKLEGLTIVYIVFYDPPGRIKPKAEYVCTCFTREQAEKEISKCMYPRDNYYIYEDIVRED